MIVENIEPLRRALRAHSLATARMQDFLAKYVELDGFICAECGDQAALFAEFGACKDALAATWNENVVVFQAEESIEQEA